MEKEIFAELARWAERGHAPSLRYGMFYDGEQALIGWMCIIHHWVRGSVSIGALEPEPIGFHPTDVFEAARTALRQAAERWPEMVDV